MIVSEIAGTTRDSVDVRFEMKDRSFLAIDTAGLRKQKGFAGSIDYYAYHRCSSRSAEAEVVLFMVDATEPISKVDQKLGQGYGGGSSPPCWWSTSGTRSETGSPTTTSST